MLNDSDIKRKKPRKKSPGYFVVIAFVVLIVVAAPGIAISIRAQQQQQAANNIQSATASPGGLAVNKKLIFDDEFNGTSLDTSKWKPCYHSGDCTNSGNNELEWYLPENVTESNGLLQLHAKKQIYNAPDGKTYHYTSGMIASTNFSFTYGYVEMRARLTACKGMWSAFWMLPTDGGWPPEIDAQEVLGKDPTTAHMFYHYGANNTVYGGAWSGPDFSAGWHTFAVDWEQNAITWYVDGVKREQDTNASTITNKPMYLLANLAVGGNWAGPPDATTVSPCAFSIDYIRVYD